MSDRLREAFDALWWKVEHPDTDLPPGLTPSETTRLASRAERYEAALRKIEVTLNGWHYTDKIMVGPTRDAVRAALSPTPEAREVQS